MLLITMSLDDLLLAFNNQKRSFVTAQKVAEREQTQLRLLADIIVKDYMPEGMEQIESKWLKKNLPANVKKIITTSYKTLNNFFEESSLPIKKPANHQTTYTPKTPAEPDFSDPLNPVFPRGYLKDEANLARAIKSYLEAKKMDAVSTQDINSDPLIKKFVTNVRLYHSVNFYPNNNIKYKTKKKGRKTSYKVNKNVSENITNQTNTSFEETKIPRENKYGIHSKEDLNTHVKTLMEEKGWEKIPRSSKFQEEGIGYLLNCITQHYGTFSKWVDEENIDLIEKKKRNSAWFSRGYVKAETKILLRKLNADKVPSEDYLLKKGMKTFVNSAREHFGSVKKMCAYHEVEYDVHYVPPPRIETNNLEEAIEKTKKTELHASDIIPDANTTFIGKLKSYVAKKGYETIPSLTTIMKDGYIQWLPTLKKMGGVSQVRAQLGYPALNS